MNRSRTTWRVVGKWSSAVREKVQGDLVPINWFVESPGHGNLRDCPFSSITWYQAIPRQKTS
jgi:hypothetical protein